ncbi:MAG: ATP:cob(I)alamin adenosyltransferase [Flavobacteriaceae bacterium]|nr:ATP:cob(I)alamin adenosyltransferase [Flavobacteriaceae bacterium]|tara:strand:- start:1113 stop:1649 length:537 start_codon:yes stop_codon:yes gene_type:complete
MKIYTRKGDSGYTSLIDGEIVNKYNLSVDAYGTIDELNSFIGLLKDYIKDDKIKGVLNNIQSKLFSIGSILASGKNQNISKKVKIQKKDVEYIELEIDRLDEYLPELKNFIIPGGHRTSSYSHVCRSVCRRAERIISELNNKSSVNPNILAFLNRLSDFFFVLSRFLKHSDNISESHW